MPAILVYQIDEISLFEDGEFSSIFANVFCRLCTRIWDIDREEHSNKSAQITENVAIKVRTFCIACATDGTHG